MKTLQDLAFSTQFFFLLRLLYQQKNYRENHVFHYFWINFKHFPLLNLALFHEFLLLFFLRKKKIKKTAKNKPNKKQNKKQITKWTKQSSSNWKIMLLTLKREQCENHLQTLLVKYLSSQKGSTIKNKEEKIDYFRGKKYINK